MAPLSRGTPLNWQIPIVHSDGRPTDEFQRAWQAQAQQNAQIPALNTAAEVSDVLDKLGATPGSLLHRGVAGWQLLTGNDDDMLRRSGGIWQAFPLSNSINKLLDALSSTRGAVLYRGAAGWSALAPGAAGDFLQTQGAGADPQWVAGGGGGGGALFTTTIGTGTSSANTSAFATKGGSLTPLVAPITIDAVYATVDATVNGSQFTAYIFTGTSTISAIVGTSSTVTWNTGGDTNMVFPFTTPVVLSAGTRYYIVISWNNAASGTTALRIFANTGISSSKWPGVLTTLPSGGGDGIVCAVTTPVVGTGISINGFNYIMSFRYTR